MQHSDPTASSLSLHDVQQVQLLGELETLAAISAEPAPVVTRVVFTAADLRARAYVKKLCAEAGLLLREDAVGNTFARWPGREPDLPAVGTGSHIDAIPNAGMYDGVVGVLGALEAIRMLKRAGFVPRHSIELLLFTSEEPTRFGIGCLGSRLLSGTLSPEQAAALTDAEGQGLDQIRIAAGFQGDLRDVPLSAGYYAYFVELHIEQGPLLEQQQISIGVVTKIAAPASLRFTIEGEGGHAGGVLMPDRKDALAAAAEVVLAAEAGALGTKAIDTVATVGICDVFPGAVNSIPSRVRLSLDVRDTDAERRDGVLYAITQSCARISEKRGVAITSELVNADSPAISDSHLVDTISSVCSRLNIPSMPMVSRAYHDSLFMARIAPMAMIFIPCRNGVSHRPDEYSSPEAIAEGVLILANTLAELAR